MLPHGSKVGHVIKQQQRLLHDVSHVPGLTLLKVSNGGIIGERNSIQHQRWGLGWDYNLLVTLPLYDSTFTRGPYLHDSSMFDPPLGLNL